MAEGKSEIPPSVLQSINPWPSRPPPGSVDHEHPAENTTLSLVIPNEPSTTPVRISITPELAEKLSDLAASFFWIFNFTIRGSPFVESGSTENIDEVQEEIKEKFGLEPLIGSDATMNNVFIRLSLKCSVFDLHHLRSIVKEKLPIDDKHVLIDQIDQVQTKVKKIKSQSEMVKLCKIINSNDSQGKKVQLNLPAGDWMKQVMIHMLFVMKHILAKVHNVEEPEIYIKRGEKGGLTVDECLKENGQVRANRLTEEDLIEVTNALGVAYPDWFLLGVQLNIPHSELKAIEDNYPKGSKRCLVDMVMAWIKRNEATWEKLVDALKCLKDISLADEIDKRHH